MKAAKFRDVDRVLRRLGYRQVRAAGSHIMYSKPDAAVVIPVPWHRGKEIPARTVRSVLGMAGVSWEEFLALR